MEAADTRRFLRSVGGFVRGKYPVVLGDLYSLALEEAVGCKCRGDRRFRCSVKGVLFGFDSVFLGVRFGEEGSLFSLSDFALSSSFSFFLSSWEYS